MNARIPQAGLPNRFGQTLARVLVMAIVGGSAPAWAMDAAQAPRAQVGYTLPAARAIVDDAGAERGVDWLRNNGLYSANASKLWDGWTKQYVDNQALSVHKSESADSAGAANGLHADATIAGSQVTGPVASAALATKASSLASGGTIDGSQITGTIEGSKISGSVASAAKADKLLNKDGVNYSSAGDLQVASAGAASQANQIWDPRTQSYQWVSNVRVAQADNARHADLLYNNYTGGYDWASSLQVGISVWTRNNADGNAGFIAPPGNLPLPGW